MVNQFFNNGSVCWKNCPLRWQRETFRVTHENDSRSDNCIFESIDHVPPNIPNSSHSTQLYTSEDSAGSGPSDHQRTTRQTLGYVRRVQRVYLDWLFEWAHLGHSIMIKYVRTAEQSADILTKGMFTTMQWHSFLILRQFIRNYESKDVFSFAHLTFLLLSSSKVPTDVSGDESSRECVRFGKSLDFGAFEQLRVYLYSRQEGSSCRKSLQSESGGRFLASWHLFSYHENTKGLWELSKMHEAGVHVFSDSVLCLTIGAMSETDAK